MTADSDQDIDDISGPSRDTVVQCLAELHEAFKYDLATKLSSSISLHVIVDATTDSARELLALHYDGEVPKGDWRISARVFEVLGHKAVEQVELIEENLEDLRAYQSALGVRETKIYHITSLTTDNTSSNTWLIGGVRAVLEETRRAAWKADGLAEEDFVPLVFKGCEDHVVHLVATELEKRLVARAIPWGRPDQVVGQRHVSATALCHIMARLKSNLLKRAFREFIAKHGGLPPSIERYSETRYASVASHPLPLLTEADLEALRWLFNPEIIAIIQGREIFAAKKYFQDGGIQGLKKNRTSCNSRIKGSRIEDSKRDFRRPESLQLCQSLP